MENNSIFIMIISLFIVIFIIVSYFIFTDTLYDNSRLDTSNATDNSINGRIALYKKKFINDTENFSSDNKNKSGCSPEVYHIRDNVFTYDEAKSVCDAYDAKLATIEQMIDSVNNGANWCNYGWSEGQMALFPIQKDFWGKLQQTPLRKYECGVPGLNGGYFKNSGYKFGANCYGVKPDQKDKAKYARLIQASQTKNKYNNYKKEYRIAAHKMMEGDGSNNKWRA